MFLVSNFCPLISQLFRVKQLQNKEADVEEEAEAKEEPATKIRTGWGNWQ